MPRPTTITHGPLAACVEHAGGVAAFAEAIGVSRATVWRWNDGVRPVPLIAAHVRRWATERGLPDPFPA